MAPSVRYPGRQILLQLCGGERPCSAPHVPAAILWTSAAVIEAVNVVAERFPRFNLSIYRIPISIVCLIL